MDKAFDQTIHLLETYLKIYSHISYRYTFPQVIHSSIIFKIKDWKDLNGLVK